MSLPLSAEIVAIDISLDGNESVKWKLGVVGGKTKNASCRELVEEKAGCGELRGLQLPGVRHSYICERLPSP